MNILFENQLKLVIMVGIILTQISYYRIAIVSSWWKKFFFITFYFSVFIDIRNFSVGFVFFYLIS